MARGDPDQRSADVATEMNRLRHALKSYYETEGASDPILISLPNRAVTTVDGTRERPWIVAEPCAGMDGATATQPPRLPANPQRSLQRVVSVAVLCAVALALVVYISMRALAAPPRPQFARMDGTILRIMDGEGKELWSKNFPAGFALDWYAYKGLPGTTWFGDLEGKGHTSVLFSYVPAGTPISHPSTLICYSDRGREKWRWSPGRDLPELAGSSAIYVTHTFGVLKATNTRPRRIVVLSQQQPWWPTQVALLDSSGKTVSEYWHSGGLSSLVLADLDDDGREEIIATGVANGYDHQATLVVLDPDRVFGASTEVRPQFQIHGMGLAKERLRLLFPRSDLNRALYQLNWAVEPSLDHGSLRLTVASDAWWDARRSSSR